MNATELKCQNETFKSTNEFLKQKLNEEKDKNKIL